MCSRMSETLVSGCKAGASCLPNLLDKVQTAIGVCKVSQRTWREAARFPESGVLPLSLTTQHEEVMGRICFVYGCSHRSDGEKGSFFRFPTHVIQRGRWERTVQVKIF